MAGSSPHQTTTHSRRILAVSDNPDGVSVRNTSDSASVYVDSIQQASSSGGVEIPPLGSIQWSPDRELWLTAPTAGLTVVVSESVDAVVDSWSIATALLGQGLPDAIAQKIEVRGAPSIDDPTVLDSTIWTSGAGFQQIGPLDTTRWQSLAIRVRASMPASTTTMLPVHCGHVYAYHYAAGIRIAQDSMLYGGDNDTAVDAYGATTLIVPARGDTVVILIDYGTVGVPMECTTVGSYRPVDRVMCRQNHGFLKASGNGSSDSDSGEGYWSWRLTSMPIGDWQEYPLLFAGAVTLTFDSRVALAAGQVNVILNDMSANRNVWGTIIPGGARFTGSFDNIAVPARPLRIIVQNQTAAALNANAALSLNQDIR